MVKRSILSKPRERGERQLPGAGHVLLLSSSPLFSVNDYSSPTLTLHSSSAQKSAHSEGVLSSTRLDFSSSRFISPWISSCPLSICVKNTSSQMLSVSFPTTLLGLLFYSFFGLIPYCGFLVEGGFHLPPEEECAEIKAMAGVCCWSSLG